MASFDFKFLPSAFQPCGRLALAPERVDCLQNSNEIMSKKKILEGHRKEHSGFNSAQAYLWPNVSSCSWAVGGEYRDSERLSSSLFKSDMRGRDRGILGRERLCRWGWVPLGTAGKRMKPNMYQEGGLVTVGLKSLVLKLWDVRKKRVNWQF